jgi:hypothetical protein
MNQKSTIDPLFKNGLQGMEAPGADDGWQRLEQPLAQQNQAQERRRKRRAAAWLLGMVALLGGTAWLWTALYNRTNTNTANTPAQQPTQAHSTPATTPVAPLPQRPAQATTSADRLVAKQGNDNGAAPNNPSPTVAQQDRQARLRLGTTPPTSADGSNDKVAQKTVRRIQQKGRQRLTIKPAETGDETAADTNDTGEEVAVATENPLPTSNEQKTTTNETTATDSAAKKQPTATTDPVAEKQPTATSETPPPAKEPSTASKDERKKKQAKSPIQVEWAAGIDISTGLGNPGKYAALMVRLPLNKKASLLTGLGFATNRLTTGYTQSDKQNLLNSPIDATLRGLTMLQFPVLYEQPIKEQKLLLRAGLMPIYILDASIVNVSNGFTGNPNNFRTFTLSDINRFNVLFSAGLHYRFTPRLGIELRANYGLTELVKNSYINQSGENNNLKSAQIGFLFMIGRKK